MACDAEDIRRSVEFAYAAMQSAGFLSRPESRADVPARVAADRLKAKWRREGLRRAIRSLSLRRPQDVRALAQALGVRW